MKTMKEIILFPVTALMCIIGALYMVLFVFKDEVEWRIDRYMWERRGK